MEGTKDIIIKNLSGCERSMDGLIPWLEESDFFTAPASTRFHGAYKGGLAKHSLNVFNTLLKLCNTFDIPYQKAPLESVVICGLLHDVCKIYFYKESTRNVKNEQTGQWEKVPCYTIDDQLPIGHGEKSVIILQRFMRLTEDEAYAIRWHMGGFDDAARGYAGGVMLSNVFQKCPLAVLLHMADLAASYLADTREEK